MNINIIYALFLSCFLSSSFSYAIEIKHVALREGSTLDQYALDLLKFLIEVSGEQVQFETFDIFGAQTRREILLQEGDYDIDWLGATKDIESRVTPILYPIFRGLLGYRIFITNKETSKTLKRGMPFDELKNYNLIQGQGWGDVAILKDGGFSQVRTIANFENIFNMIDLTRVDLFPRAIIEPYGELRSRCNLDNKYVCTDKNMRIDDKLLLIYKLPMLYFVSPERQDIIKLLNTAFEEHYNDYLTFFNNHPLIKDALSKLKGRSIYHIKENSSLSEETNMIADKYWLNLKM